MVISFRAYADQTLAMNRMRGMLEDEMTEKRNQKLKEMQLENKRLALEKKQREQRWRQDQEYSLTLTSLEREPTSHWGLEET